MGLRKSVLRVIPEGFFDIAVIEFQRGILTISFFFLNSKFGFGD